MGRLKGGGGWGNTGERAESVGYGGNSSSDSSFHKNVLVGEGVRGARGRLEDCMLLNLACPV